jgi:hypothetical protein
MAKPARKPKPASVQESNEPIEQIDDIHALNDNLVPLWLTLRALVKLKVIEPQAFMTALHGAIDDELNRYPVEQFDKEALRKQVAVIPLILGNNMEPTPY